MFRILIFLVSQAEKVVRIGAKGVLLSRVPTDFPGEKYRIIGQLTSFQH